MPLPLGPILLAGATAAVGWFFQNHSAKLARERQLRDSELKQAQEIFEEVSNSMDALYFYLRHGAMHVAVRKARQQEAGEAQSMEDAATWEGYEEAVLDWMTNKTRFLAQMRRYFGEANRRRLRHIQQEFGKAGGLVAATYYDRKASVVKEDGTESSGDYYLIVKPLEARILELSEQMIAQIQSQRVGQLRFK